MPNYIASVVPYIPLQDEKKREIEDALRQSATLIAKYCSVAKAQRTTEKISKNLFFSEFQKNYKKGSITEVRGVLIPPDDSACIASLKSVEWDVLCAFSSMVSKIVFKWSGRSQYNIEAEDLSSEAFKAVVECLVHFTEEQRLSTFIHHCVNRRLSRLCRRSSRFSDLSSNAVDLKAKYTMLASEEGSNFDSIVEKMKLSPRRKRMLQAALCEVHNMSSIEKNESELCIVDDSEASAEAPDKSILNIAHNLDLSDLERAVLEGFLSSKTKLGLNELSKNLVNPKTQKPYSRMAFTLAWRRIKEKIQQAYPKVA